MSPALQAALTVGAWALVVVLLAGGFWFLRRNELLDTAAVMLLALGGLFLLIRLKDLVFMLLLAGVVAFILSGLVERLARSLPRGLAIAVVYVSLAVLLACAGAFVIPRLVEEGHHLIRESPRLAERAKRMVEEIVARFGGPPRQTDRAIETLTAELETVARNSAGQVGTTLMGAVGWAVKGVISLVISVYLLTDQRNIREQFLRLFPEQARPEVQGSLKELSQTFGRYLSGQAIVMLFVAASVTGVLIGFRIPYAFLIGLTAGLLEVIPYFGAIVGALPAVTLGFMRSPGTGIAAVVLFILINQIEGHVVVPLVMGRHLDVRPLTILLALIAGEQLYGVPGMILAVPVLSLLRVLLPHVVRHCRAGARRQTPDASSDKGTGKPPN
jgi:predicted PurR-regulated permease PerM